ncbi:unnamed protein product [Absidia cylindrospora]
MNGNHLDRRYFVEVFENCSLDDWQYEMRREIQELLPGLYLGPFNICRDIQLLQSLGVTHILSILDSSELALFQRTLEITTNLPITSFKSLTLLSNHLSLTFLWQINLSNRDWIMVVRC